MVAEYQNGSSIIASHDATGFVMVCAFSAVTPGHPQCPSYVNMYHNGSVVPRSHIKSITCCGAQDYNVFQGTSEGWGAWLVVYEHSISTGDSLALGDTAGNIYNLRNCIFY